MGWKQADELGHHLAALHLETPVVISSPLLRAWQTASVVGDALGTAPRSETFFRERSYNHLELADRQTTIEERLSLGLSIVQPTLIWPAGSGPESQQVLTSRVELAFEQLMSNFRAGAYQNIVVVTHDGVIRALFDHYFLHDMPSEVGLRMNPASYISFLVHESGEWELRTLWRGEPGHA